MPSYELNLMKADTAYLFSTVRLVLFDERGETGSATAFFFQDTGVEDRPSYIVTNRHVVTGQHAMRAQFHLSTNRQRHRFVSRSSDWVEIRDPEAVWHGHPNPDIDLCALREQELREIAGGRLDELFFAPMRSGGIREPAEERNYPAILQVAMIGYPVEVWDSVNNLPVIRRGTTASHPAVDFNGRPEVVIDMACFPGSSGSPVVFFDRAYFSSAHRFLGVLYSGPYFSHEGEIVVRDIPTRRSIIPVSHQMVHLGFVIKASEVLNLVRHLEGRS